MNVIVPTTELRDALRMIWRAPDQRTKEWAIVRLIDVVVIDEANPRDHVGFPHLPGAGNDLLIPLPTPTLLEQILNLPPQTGTQNKGLLLPRLPCTVFPSWQAEIRRILF